MLVKDATLEAGIDKGEPSRLLIEISLRPDSLAGLVPAYDPGEVQRAIRDGFREVLAHEQAASSIEAPSPGSQSTGAPATSNAAPITPPPGPATFGLHVQ